MIYTRHWHSQAVRDNEAIYKHSPARSHCPLHESKHQLILSLVTWGTAANRTSLHKIVGGPDDKLPDGGW